jgi:hypothetical protein
MTDFEVATALICGGSCFGYVVADLGKIQDNY